MLPTIIRNLLLVVLCCFVFVRVALADSEVKLAPEGQEQHIHSISFRSSLPLADEDLISTVPIRAGDLFDRKVLQESIENLSKRDIFDHINVETKNTSEGVEVIFDLQPTPIIGEIIVAGNKTIDTKKIKRISEARIGSKLDFALLEQGKSQIEDAYKAEGFYETEISVNIEDRSVAPQVVASFHIKEGYRSKLHTTTLRGTFPPDIRPLKDKFITAAKGIVATKKNIKALGQELLLALRQEGYLQASVKVQSTDYDISTQDVDVELFVSPRRPISIIFTGNNFFSPSELLAPLHMETRTVPFSPHAISTLVREITRLYQNYGFWFAEVDYRTQPSEGRRRLYEIIIHENEQVRIRNIHFDGNKHISSRELASLMKTRSRGFWILKHWRPGYLMKDPLVEDLSAFEELYDRRGYIGTTAIVEFHYHKQRRLMDLVILIDEKPQIHLKEIVLEFKKSSDTNKQATDNQQFTKDTFSELEGIYPKIPVGEPLDRDRIEQERRRINEELLRLGYPNATLETRLDETREKLRYIIDPGEHISVGSVWLQGNHFTHDFVIKRELSFQPGHDWDPSKLEKSVESLYRLGLFRSVNIEPFDGQLDGPVEDIAVRVEERDTGSFDTGIGLNTEDGLHLAAELGQRNLAGNGSSLILGFDTFLKSSPILNAARSRVVYTTPHFLDTSGDLVTEGFAQYGIKLFKNYSYNRLGTSFFLRDSPAEKMLGRFGLVAFEENVFDVKPDIAIGSDDNGSRFLSMLQLDLDFDRRNDTFNPTRGFRSFLEAKLASELLGSAVSFAGLSLQQSFYSPLGEYFGMGHQLVLAENIRLARLIPFAGTEVIPLSQRLFLGGRDSLRGFSLGAVGPRGFSGNIVGGDTSFIINSELQYGVTENFLGVLFLDIGQAILERKGNFQGDPLHFSDARFSPGIGARYKTPIGPVSVDLGFALDRQFGERFGRLNIGIGGAF